MSDATDRPTHIVAGGGPAGCSPASRLSEIPDDIADIYAHRAMTNTASFCPALQASLGRHADVADASIMPRAARANANLPFIIIAERVPDLVPRRL